MSVLDKLALGVFLNVFFAIHILIEITRNYLIDI